MVGKTISHYRILEKLGEGGMGVVYKAQDTKLDRFVALKFLPLHLGQAEEEKKRFIHEAKAASALDHNNICTIYEIDETKPAPGEPGDGRMFIAMACYDGESLKKKIERGPLPIAEAIDIAIQVAEGLAKAHGQGIVHRDMKPANVIVTNDGVVKIVDFGLAKLAGRTKLTRSGTTMGTVAYMSPEQAQGTQVDQRTDIWSLGVVLYEMLTGQQPFKGDYEQAVVYSILNEDPEPIKALRKDIPEELEQIITRSLAKDRKLRYSSMNKLCEDLTNYQTALTSLEFGLGSTRQVLRLIKRPQIAIPGILSILFLCLIAVWFINQSTKIRWAREKAMPEIVRLVDEEDYTAAIKLTLQAERYIPKDPQLIELLPEMERTFSIETTPSGAEVYMKDYMDIDGDWEFLGKSPINNARISRAFKRWRIVKDGFEIIERTDNRADAEKMTWLTHIKLSLKLVEKGTIPHGMVQVMGSITNIGELDDFLLDKHEVTNRQFTAFVDSGGYRKQEYWKHKFVKEGRILTWEEAMAEFVDTLGRPGPAVWELGDYPEGQDDYPVTGISWYEAAAYAEFAGKSLPTIYHWEIAVGRRNSPYIIPHSNFEGKGAAPVGKYHGMGPYGTYDMAGNVKEWCWNETGNKRYIRGGAWNDPQYMFESLDKRSPFLRGKNIGFRCAQYFSEKAIPKAAFDPVTETPPRDFSKEKPCSDEIFQIYKSLYTYGKTELDPVIEFRDETSKDYIMEKVCFNAAYGNERMLAYLFLPKIGTSHYQTIIHFPGAGAGRLNSIEDYPIELLNFITKSGRAWVFPIYQDTFERRLPANWKWTQQNRRDYRIMLSKDLGTTIDYLETRPEFDREKLGYLGSSWGAWLGAILPAIEKRLKVVVLVSGGLNSERSLPEVSQINFAPRITVPVLMLNGKYDHAYLVETNQKILFDLLGTSDKDKKHVLFETGHDVWSTKKFMKEILDFLDHYLGPAK